MTLQKKKKLAVLKYTKGCNKSEKNQTQETTDDLYRSLQVHYTQQVLF